MSVSTVRPTSTVANGTSSIGGGAGSRHAALSDNSDTTYVDITGAFGNPTTFAFTPPVVSGVIGYGLSRFDSYAEGGTFPVLQVGTYLDMGSNGQGVGVTVGANRTVQTGASSFGDGSSLAVSLWRQAGSATALRVYELFLDVYYVAAPVVDVTAPTGTIDYTNRPTVTWTTTYDVDGEGAGPADFQVRVFTDAVYGGGGFNAASSTAVWETDRAGTPTGISGTLRVTTNLANDTYRAYVRGKDSVGGWGSWDYAEFTINVTPPDAPALLVANDKPNGRVTATVTPDNSPVATDGVLLQRQSGSEWVTVIEADGGSPHTLYDYFAENGTAQNYRAYGWNDVDGERLYSAAATGSATADWDFWLKHPTNSALNIKPVVRAYDDAGSSARQSENQPVGREDVVVISDTRSPDKGSLTLRIGSRTAQKTLRALLATLDPIYISTDDEDLYESRWVVFGEWSSSRLLEKKWSSPFDITLGWTEVAAP